MRTRILGVFVFSTLVACKLFQASPAKVCEQKEKLGEAWEAPQRDKCRKDLAELQRDNPAGYKCMSKCIAQSTSQTDATECEISVCPSASARTETASASDTDTAGEDVATFVDGLTDYSLKNRLESEYRYYGYELIKESSNTAGWAGSIRLGKPGSDAQLYRVMLGDASSNAEGRRLVSGLFSSSKDKRANWKVGDKKFVYVECMAAVDSTGGTGPCYSGDRSEDMLTALAKAY